MKKTIFAIVILGLILAVALVRGIKQPAVLSGSDETPSRPEIKHVLLLTIDSLRADALPVHGNTRIATPHLSELCEQSVVFKRAQAPSPWTRPSILSILTGLPPSIHAATEREIEVEVVLPESIPILAKCMRAAGYRTAGIGFNPYLALSPNTKRGFQEYYFYPSRIVRSDNVLAQCDRVNPQEGAFESTRGLENTINRYNSTEDLTELTEKWLARHANEKFFLWLHYLDPHLPYTPSRDCLSQIPGVLAPRDDTEYEKGLDQLNTNVRNYLYVERKLLKGIGTANDKEIHRLLHDSLVKQKELLRAVYDAEVIHIDRAVGRVLDMLRNLKIYDETLVIVTSDHGEEFFEHGHLEHGHSFYQELLHVPLIVKPTGHGQARRVEERVSIMSIFPTILELCSVAPPARGLPLPSLAGWWETSAHATKPPLSPHFISQSVLYGESGEAVVFHDRKYIRRNETGSKSRSEELYDLISDPAERVSLAASNPEIVDRARKILDAQAAWSRALKKQIWTRGVETTPQDEEARKLLRSLGYFK